MSLAGETQTEDFALAGWSVWQHPELRFTVTQESSVTVGAHIAYGAGGWGTFDDLELRRLPGEGPAEPFFIDVADESLYYYDAVYWALENGVTAGTSANTFSPDLTCTRAQIVTFLWRAMGSPEADLENLPFCDVPESAYYAIPAAWAWETGVSVGTGPDTFSPSRDCSRAEIMTMFWSAMSKPQPELSESPFTDVQPGDWYLTAVLWAVENAVTGGVGDGQFGPDQTCTRAEAVTFLWRVLGQ